MFALRRAAVRAFASSRVVVPTKARSFTRLSTVSIPQRQNFLLPIQRRFASDEARPEDQFEAPETAAPTEAAEAAESISQSKSIYVGNLFFQTTEDDILKEFSQFGKIAELKIVRNPRGMSKGFGFITYENRDDAVTAAEQKNQSVLDGRRIAVALQDGRPALRRGGDAGRSPNPPSKTLFIGNLSYEMTDKDLNDLFRDIRNVLDVRVAVDRRTGMPRGFAHADFIDEVSASKGMEILNGKQIHGRTLKLDFSAPVNPARDNGSQ